MSELLLFRLGFQAVRMILKVYLLPKKQDTPRHTDHHGLLLSEK